MGSKKGTRKKKANPAMTHLHKEERKVRHAKKVEKDSIRKKIRLELLAQAKQITGKKEGELKHLVGTLNIKRLTDIVENRYLNAPYFVARQKKQEEKKNSDKPIKSKVTTNTIRETLHAAREKKNKKRAPQKVSK